MSFMEISGQPGWGLTQWCHCVTIHLHWSDWWRGTMACHAIYCPTIILLINFVLLLYFENAYVKMKFIAFLTFKWWLMYFYLKYLITLTFSELRKQCLDMCLKERSKRAGLKEKSTWTGIKQTIVFQPSLRVIITHSTLHNA